jgi:hypothetical protein
MIIHIGKCGGSNINYKFKTKHKITIPIIHCCKCTSKHIINSDHICILLRDPITRYISIYYYYYDLYKRYMNGENIPHRNIIIKQKNIFLKFNTANKLAEALNSENLLEKNIAESSFILFSHLNYNYEYYLSKLNIENIKKYKKIFIIRQEFYDNDFKIYYYFLIQKYKINNPNFNFFIENKRNNTEKYNDQKYLSKKAIDNLKNKMKNDYNVLNNLLKHDLITKEYINGFI